MSPFGSARVLANLLPEMHMRYGGNEGFSGRREAIGRQMGVPVFVVGIKDNMSYYQLKQVFEQYGAIQSLFLQAPKRTGCRHHFAFVRYRHDQDAWKAIKEINGVFYNNSLLSVKRAHYGSSTKGKKHRSTMRSGLS